MAAEVPEILADRLGSLWLPAIAADLKTTSPFFASSTALEGGSLSESPLVQAASSAFGSLLNVLVLEGAAAVAKGTAMTALAAGLVVGKLALGTALEFERIPTLVANAVVVVLLALAVAPVRGNIRRGFITHTFRLVHTVWQVPSLVPSAETRGKRRSNLRLLNNQCGVWQPTANFPPPS
jgi:lysylphosphatidylglycerol synthetase-like protein (DUF2156 family)